MKAHVLAFMTERIVYFYRLFITGRKHTKDINCHDLKAEDTQIGPRPNPSKQTKNDAKELSAVGKLGSRKNPNARECSSSFKLQIDVWFAKPYP